MFCSSLHRTQFRSFTYFWKCSKIWYILSFLVSIHTIGRKSRIWFQRIQIVIICQRNTIFLFFMNRERSMKAEVTSVLHIAKHRYPNRQDKSISFYEVVFVTCKRMREKNKTNKKESHHTITRRPVPEWRRGVEAASRWRLRDTT